MSDLLNKNIHLSTENIAQYVDAMQKGDAQHLPSIWLEHIENCNQCYLEVVDLQVIMSSSSPKELSKVKPYKYVLRLLLLFVITLLSLFFFDRENEAKKIPQAPLEIQNKPKIQNKASIPLAEKEVNAQNPGSNDNSQKSKVKKENQNLKSQEIAVEKFAANFVPSEDLAALAGADLRTAGMDNLTPVIDAHFKIGEMITFSWNFEQEKTYWLYILNNREEKLTVQETSDTAFIYNQKLDPGLYYWKIEDEEELLFVGTFFIVSNEN